MSLNYWLYEATGTFPRGVRERLRQEYGAHLADSIVAGGSDDPFELFGDPGKVRKALGKSYIDQKRLAALKKPLNWPLWVLLGGSLLPSVVSFFIGFGPRSVITVCLILTGFASVFYLMNRLQYERKVMWRNVGAIVISQVVVVSPQFFSPLSTVTGQFLALVSLTALTLFVVMSTAQDRRVRRTIELERNDSGRSHK